MSDSPPDWFASDQVHDAGDGFYVGAANGFRVGPFATRNQAESQSRELTLRLKRCRNVTERVRLLRRFIIDQRLKHGRQVRGAVSPTQTTPTAAGDAPPTRAGERPRVWFRTHRVFAVGESWFFATREGLDVGPYVSNQAARQDAERLRVILQSSPDPTAAMRLILEFIERNRSESK
jgi:hypothetical protein